jgi:hypothetical protein
MFDKDDLKWWKVAAFIAVLLIVALSFVVRARGSGLDCPTSTPRPPRRKTPTATATNPPRIMPTPTCTPECEDCTPVVIIITATPQPVPVLDETLYMPLVCNLEPCIKKGQCKNPIPLHIRKEIDRLRASK